MYKFNKKTLEYTKISGDFIAIFIFSICLLVGITMYCAGKHDGNSNIDRASKEDLVMVLNSHENNNFTPVELYTYLKDLNIKYPDIVFAQAVLESGNFGSSVFRSNHNLFGMKEASRRPTCSLGTELNHAYYNNWKESVIDMALFQCKYLSDIKTREQYLEYLDKNYAEIGDYRARIEKVIKANSFNLPK